MGSEADIGSETNKYGSTGLRVEDVEIINYREDRIPKKFITEIITN